MRRLLTAAAAVSLVTAIGAQPPLFQADSHLALLQFQLKPKKGCIDCRAPLQLTL